MIQQLIRKYVEWLIILLIIFSVAYIVVMFDGQVNQESIIEALNYSAQTVTTVVTGIGSQRIGIFSKIQGCIKGCFL